MSRQRGLIPPLAVLSIVYRLYSGVPIILALRTTKTATATLQLPCNRACS